MTDNAVKNCVAWFSSCHMDIIGSPYLISYGKDQAIMKQVVGLYGVNKTQQLIKEFFREVSDSTFLQETGASVGIFRSQVPKLLLKINSYKEKEQTGKL